MKSETSHNLDKIDLTACFQFSFFCNVLYVINIQHFSHWSEPNTPNTEVILSFYIHASLVSPCKPRSSFIALSACPECPRGAAEWPVAQLTLRAAVTLHLSALHLGWCGHLATRPGFAAHGPEAIGKSIDTPRPNLESCLLGWLTLLPSLSLPYTPPPPLPCYGQMKTMQFSLYHTSLYVDILLQDKKCLCLPRGLQLSRLMYLSCQLFSISTNVWIERRRDGN